jgi:DNA processing protein
MNRKDAIQTLIPARFPPILREIADPPRTLWIRGTLPNPSHKYLCVVGSRSYSPYGRDICARLIAGLAGHPIAIVSGLALGIDGIAHTAALQCGLPTIAVPGSGLDEAILYPRAHVGLSREILEKGGALVSELPPEAEANVWSFPKRNRLMAGMCHAILVIEARERSGTLITARLGMEYNRDVLVAPSPLFSPNGAGSNQLLREGAQAITHSDDILEALHLPKGSSHAPEHAHSLSEEEKKVFAVLENPVPRDELLRTCGLDTTRAQIIISSMEIKGVVRERLGCIERA